LETERNFLHCAIFQLVAGEWETARADFSRILSFQPGHSAALAGSGVAMLMLGMREEADSRLAAAAAAGDNGDMLALCAIASKGKGLAGQARDILMAGKKHFPANKEIEGLLAK